MKRIHLFLILGWIPICLLSLATNISCTSNSFMEKSDKDGIRTWRMAQVEGSSIFGRGTDTYYYSDHSIYPDSIQTYIPNLDEHYSTYFIYDFHHEYVHEVHSYKVATGQLIEPAMWMNLDYNADNHLTDYTFKKINPTTTYWDVSNIWHYSYTEQMLTSYKNADYDASPAYRQGVCYYDELGRMNLEWTMWSADSTTWNDEYEIDTTYHPSDTTTSDAYADDLAHTKAFSVFFPTAKPTPKFAQIFRSNANMSEPNLLMLILYTYDSQDRIFQVTEEHKESLELSWHLYYSQTYSYDANNNISHIYHYDYTVQPTSSWVEVYTWEQSTANEDLTLSATLPILSQNYPNPFNPETTIKYSLPQSSKVKIEIYNIRGQIVKTLIDEKQAPGKFSVKWNGNDDSEKQVSSGVYFYRLDTDNRSITKKMVLLK